MSQYINNNNNNKHIFIPIIYFMNSIQWLLLYIVKLNGLYDILCAMAILDIGITIPLLQNIHLSMFLSSDMENTQTPSDMRQEFIGDSSIHPEINKTELSKRICLLDFYIWYN